MVIRQLERDEFPLIQGFIEDYWRKGHSLAKSKALLDFQHLQSGRYNFFAALDGETVWALQGFITTDTYDPVLGCGDAWGAIWKIRDDAPDKMVGLELLDRITHQYGTRSMGAVGISGVAKKIYKMLSWKTGYLHQYFIPNDLLTSFSVLLPQVPLPRRNHIFNSNWRIDVCCSIRQAVCPDNIYKPAKSLEYFINKYEVHPLYRYQFWCVYEGDALRSVWAVRRVVARGVSVFRIVDVLGRIEGFPDLYCQVQMILREESAEYVDIMNYGIDGDVFRALGFDEIYPDKDEIICPNNFEPFERHNVKIEVAYKSTEEYVCFKGDSDQDRPNIL